MSATTRSDSDVQMDILEELRWAPEIDETDIGVIVSNGAVILTGTVPSYPAKKAAIDATRRIRGVRAVADEIDVKLPSQLGGTDEDIAQRIANILRWDTQIPGDDIQAEVQDGLVTLSGDVDWQYQKKYVERQIEGIRGVRFISNLITVRRRPIRHDVQKQIVKALHRQASLEASQVDVAVTNGVVTLSGKVDSFRDMELIRNAAWSAPGVTQVIDHMHLP